MEHEETPDLLARPSPRPAASPMAIWIAMISVYIVWGSTYLAIRFAVETIPPFLMAATRFLIAGGILYTWRYITRDTRPTRIEWRSAAIVGFFLIVGGNGSVVWAEQKVPSGIAALLVASAPLWMVLIDLIRPSGRAARAPGRLTILGVVLGFSGIVLLVGPGQLLGLGEGVDLIGAAVLTLAALSWSIGSIYSRGARLPASPLLGTSMEMLAGGAGLLILGTITGEWTRLDISTISTRSVLSLIYLILFGSLIGFASYTWLLRVAPTALVSTYAYVNPLVAIFVGYFLAGEPLTLRILIATAIIISAVALISLAQPLSKKTKKAEAATD